MPEDITPPVEQKPPVDPAPPKDDLGKPMLGRQVEKAPEVPARSAEEQAAYDKLDDAGKKKADEDRLEAIKSAKTDIKPPARTPEEQAAYDKMSDEDKKKDDDARLKKAEEEAKDKALDLWANIEPRALRWTHEPPKVAGQYWQRKIGYPQSATIASIDDFGSGMRCKSTWGDRTIEKWSEFEWAGPIAPPVEE